MTFAFSSLLHLLRERALHDEEVVDGGTGHGLGGGGGVGRSAGGGDVNGVGKREGVGNAGSLASNPGALLLQGRVQLLVAKKRAKAIGKVKPGMDLHVQRNLGQVTSNWVPIRYVNREHSRQQLAGIFRAARIGLVTPLQDGMNLVAKEFIGNTAVVKVA